MKRGRPRQLDPRIPAHIDQAKIPADVYFDHRWGGSWYALLRVQGKRVRRTLAPASAKLVDLHKRLEEVRADDTRGTMDWLCGLFASSDAFAGLAEKTQVDYVYCRGILQKRRDKAGLPLARWPIPAFTSPVIQLLVDGIGKTHPAKANHLLRYLRRLFRCGGNRGYCAKVNPAAKIEPSRERKRRPMPIPATQRAVIAFARERGAMVARRKGALRPYLWALAEIAYRCRLRGIEVVTLTDANSTDDGILSNRRKGSRDNVTAWSPELRQAWDALVAQRTRIWTRKRIARPLRPEDRPLVVGEDGTALSRRALTLAWKRLMRSAIAAGVIEEGDRFGMHAFKRRGITDTKGTRDVKQQASGHKSASQVDVYDFDVPLVRPAGE